MSFEFEPNANLKPTAICLFFDMRLRRALGSSLAKRNGWTLKLDFHLKKNIDISYHRKKKPQGV